MHICMHACMQLKFLQHAIANYISHNYDAIMHLQDTIDIEYNYSIMCIPVLVVIVIDWDTIHLCIYTHKTLI